MKPVIIIQARTGSTRLPQKMIKPFFGEKTVLDILLERLKSIGKEYVADIILASSNNSNDDAIEKIGNTHNVKVFRGSENDVLKRFIDAAEKYNVDKIIRVCADNVFLDVTALAQLAAILDKNEYDYISYQTRSGKPSILTHYGFLAEGVKLSALRHVAMHTQDAEFHEHVTNRIHSAQNLYKVKLLPIELVIPGLEAHHDLRLTLDTQEDFEVQQHIYADLTAMDSSFTPQEIMDYLDNKHPEYYQIMAETIKANTK